MIRIVLAILLLLALSSATLGWPLDWNNWWIGGPGNPEPQPIVEPPAAMATPQLIATTPIPGYTPVPTITGPIASQCPDGGELFASPQGHAYDACWSRDFSRLHQPWLPPKPQRQAHQVSITITIGTYVLNAVECELRLDSARNGKGLENPVTAGYGNGLPFSVSTSDGQPAWAIVNCLGNQSTGFEIVSTP